MKANLISGVAAVALIAIFVGSAFLTLSSVASMQRNQDKKDAAVAMSALFDKASAEAQEAERYIGLFNSTGDAAYLLEQQRAQASFGESLAQFANSPKAEDREFAVWANDHFGAMSAIFDRLHEEPPPAFEELLQQYFYVYGALYASVAAGDIGDPAIAAELINPDGITNPAELTANPVTIIMAAKVRESDQVAAAATTETDRAETRFRQTAPILYTVGTVLALALLGITIRFGRREASSAAENAQLRRLSTTDALTQLGNRRGFEEATKRLVDSPMELPVSLVMLDLDEFKVVNDTFGHARGDAILSKFAALISQIAPPGASRFRVGGDEFAVILHGLDAGASLRFAERVRRAAMNDLGNGVTVTAGVAILDAEDPDLALLQQKADAALYEGKLRGRNTAVLYDHEGSATPVFPAVKLHAVRLLLEEGRIDAVFQPIWDIRTSALFGYEGLSRPHADYGLSGPQEAFDIAEQFGHAADLDRLCRNHLLAAAHDLPPKVRLFINLSPYSLTHQSFSASALVQEIIAAGIEPARVVFEITEKSQIGTESIAEAVSLLRAEGLSVALDDVGAGNNGLEMLRKVPFDFVKIDRDVIVAAATDGMGRAAVMAILAFASESGAIVVAEGVEDANMFSTVRTIANQTALKGKPGLIHGVQGFMFGMPLPASETARELPPMLAA
ncbi:MAG: bifunctional diguanylate cyclase/phosphodiesterase [bacterium]